MPPKQYCAGDIPHLGVIYRQNRQAAGRSLSSVAHAAGVSPSTLKAFEETGAGRRYNIQKYVDAFFGGDGAGPRSNVLGDEAARRVFGELYAGYIDRESHEGNLGNLTFDLIKAPYRPDALVELLEQARLCQRPAFIIDPLWHIHAVNGATLYLFGLDPTAEYMHSWQFWHVLGTKYARNSPVRTAHFSIDTYFPPAVHQFFLSTTSVLFTVQMRNLLCALHTMSQENGYNFTQAWQAATTFNLPFNEHQSIRVLRYREHLVNVFSAYDAGGEAMEHLPEDIWLNRNVAVRLTAETTLPYVIGFWNPLDNASRAVLDDIWMLPEANKVFFAADFDRDTSFHVNTWAPVKEALKASLAT